MARSLGVEETSAVLGIGCGTLGFYSGVASTTTNNYDKWEPVPTTTTATITTTITNTNIAAAAATTTTTTTTTTSSCSKRVYY